MKSFEKFLVDEKFITQEQLELFLTESQKSKLSLQEYLLEKNVIPEDSLAKALAKYASFPFVEKITDKMTDPELLAKTTFKFLRDNAVIPIKQKNELFIVVADPINFQSMDELNMILGGHAAYAVGPRSVVIEAINRFYPLEETHQMMEELEESEPETLEFEEIDEKDILGMASDAPIIKLVNSILFQAVKREASDIHIEPQEKEVRVRLRVYGVMHKVLNPPKRAQGALISRIKIMANLNIAEKRKPQDGRIQIKIADRSIDLRVSVLPTTFGESVVMRLFDQTKSITDLQSLGFGKKDYEIFSSEFKFIVYTSQANLLKPYKEKLNDKLEVREYVPRKELLQVLSKVDFLVNFDNNTTTQLPSKLIDYSIADRPVLNITSKLNTDIIQEFMEGNYSNKMDILPSQNFDIRLVAKKFTDLHV